MRVPAAAESFYAPGLLDDAVAVVTGGSSGIGFGIAKTFAALGAEVLITGRSEERLSAASVSIAGETGHSCATFACDVRDEEAVTGLREQVIKLFGTVTVLVNNAAANFRMAAERMTSRAFGTVVEVDLFGTFLTTSKLVGDMIDHGGGVILNVVVPDAERGFPGYAHSGAAKAGIISLTRTWAREWGPHGIRVNAVGPGPVPTDGVARNMLGLAEEATGGAFGDRVETIPLRRLGTVDDVAAASAFLCSPAAAWISGVSLNIDGGGNVS